MEPLFPELPENLAALSDEELQEMLIEHQAAADLIDSEDEHFLAGLEAADVLAQYEIGVSQMEAIRALQKERLEAEKTYDEEKEKLAARRKALEEADEEVVEAVAEEVETAAEETPEEEEKAEEPEEAEEAPAESELTVVASGVTVAETTTASTSEGQNVNAKPLPLRRPPAPTVERQLKERDKGAVLVATAGQLDIREGKVLDSHTLAEAMHQMALRKGKPHKSPDGPEEKFVVARALYDFPPDAVIG